MPWGLHPPRSWSRVQRPFAAVQTRSCCGNFARRSPANHWRWRSRCSPICWLEAYRRIRRRGRWWRWWGARRAMRISSPSGAVWSATSRSVRQRRPRRWCDCRRAQWLRSRRRRRARGRPWSRHPAHRDVPEPHDRVIGARARLAFAFGVASLIATPALDAQLYVGVDLSGAVVHYDGFLSASALSVSPSLVLDGAHGSVAARASVLTFETGRTSVQGTLAGATFLHLSDRMFAELSGEGGSSTYSSLAPIVHGVGRVRVHLFTGDATGLWVAGSGGGVHYEAVQRGLWVASAGAWTRVSPALLSATVSRSAVGDTAYTDIQGNLLWERGALQLTGNAGVRAWSVGGGRGVYGEMGATWWLGHALGVMV